MDIAVKQCEKSFYYRIDRLDLSSCICGKAFPSPLGAQALIDFCHQKLRLIFLRGVLSTVWWVPLFAFNCELGDLLGKRGVDWLEDLGNDESLEETIMPSYLHLLLGCISLPVLECSMLWNTFTSRCGAELERGCSAVPSEVTGCSALPPLSELLSAE